ncbi:MAG: cytochrome c oxidase subunit II [Rhodospirillaceae bacterium]
MQSTLHPAGPEATEVALLWWVMFGASVFIMGLVVGLIAWGLTRATGRERFAGMPMIVGLGIVFPVVVITPLIVWSVDITSRVRAAITPAVTVEVVGRQFWWEVRYPGHGIVTANEIRVPVGQPVELVLTTADVIHSLWFPEIAGKLDMIPGRANRMVIQADRAGTFRGQCAEFCGIQHALMALVLVAEPPDAFEDWATAQSQPPPPPEDPFLVWGRDAFLAAGCGTCHAVRGTPAKGTFGPDLSHVGSRVTLGAGVLPNGIGPLAGWIADSQAIKPGNHIPAFNTLDGETLRAVAAWLESLK